MPENIPPITPPPIVPPPVIDEDFQKINFDEDGYIADELSCRSCGYNLQGLHPESMCPECGASIARSIHGDKLRYSDPAWISRLARGTRWIIVGTSLSILGSMFINTVLSVISSTGTIPMSSIETVGAILGACLSIITITGIWWLTSPDPGQFETEPQFSARVIARWCILASLLQVPLEILGYQPGQLSATNPAAALSPMIMVLSMVTVLMQIIVIIGFVATLKYFARLARRIPHASLVINSRIVMWGLGISMGLESVMELGLLLVMPSFLTGANPANPSFSSMAPFMLLVFGSCIFIVSLLVFAIWGIVLLIRFNTAFKKIAHEANYLWAASSPAKPDSASPGGE